MKSTWLMNGTLAVAVMAATNASAQNAPRPGNGPAAQVPIGAQGPGGSPGSQGPTGVPGAPGTPDTSGGTRGGGTGQGSDVRMQNDGSSDRQAVEKMLMDNMAEVQLGEIGVKQATNADVKSFAQMMVDDHTKSNQELMPIADKLGARKPAQLDSKHKSIADKLEKAQGADFDRQFMAVMVDSHKQALKDAKPLARSESGSPKSGAVGTSGTSTPSPGSSSTGTSSTTGTSGSSASTAGSMSNGQTPADYAAKTTPIIQQHLAHAQTLQKSIKSQSASKSSGGTSSSGTAPSGTSPSGTSSPGGSSSPAGSSSPGTDR